MADARPCKVAVMLSGSGTTLQNIFDNMDAGKLPGVSVDLVVSNKANAYGLTRAKERNIQTCVVESAKYRVKDVKPAKWDWEGMSKEICEHIAEAKIDLVILAGFMCMFILPSELDGKVMNVHPALIPAFSGQGMYGDKVHKAVVARGAKVTGCTVHFVTNEYDAGPIILQKVTPVTTEDSWEAVQDRVQALEREAYPEAIGLFAAGRLTVKDGLVHVAN
eukprot:TRINITY_DN30490_c0_g1_i1.p1 TRINITY_DN30490_c0_g1~~TRINITY_DN30490_c0_g1_i1.p1  ORF type:complete len:238 (+),score=108.91 TRINITY_DN30490_c0_g1_i1:56-715(+)